MLSPPPLDSELNGGVLGVNVIQEGFKRMRESTLLAQDVINVTVPVDNVSQQGVVRRKEVTFKLIHKHLSN